MILLLLGALLAMSALVGGFGSSDSGSISGTDGDDDLYGSDRNDSIEGLDGNDTIFGFDGDDSIDGGGGADSVYGGQGADSLAGEWVRAGDGNDTLQGNYLDGGDGDDLFWGTQGDDRFFPGEGVNTIHGGEGNDRLERPTGENLFYGGDGRDVAFANSNDTIYGGAGDDRFNFNLGLLDEGATSSSISGGGDTDTIYLSSLFPWNDPSVRDYSITLGSNLTGMIASEHNRISVESVERFVLGHGDHFVDASESSEDLFVSLINFAHERSPQNSYSEGDSSVLGGSGDDFIQTNYLAVGGEGDDTLIGDNGGVVGDSGLIRAIAALFGGEGDDLISARVYEGGADGSLLFVGNCTLEGGLGSDTVVGSGSGMITGGDGNDFLGGFHGSTLEGGDGVDSFEISAFSSASPYNIYPEDATDDQMPDLVHVRDFDASSETLMISVMEYSGSSHSAAISQAFDNDLGGVVIFVDDIPAVVLEGVNSIDLSTVQVERWSGAQGFR